MARLLTQIQTRLINLTWEHIIQGYFIHALSHRLETAIKITDSFSRLWMQARIKKVLLFLSELTICQCPLWLPGMVLAQRRQSLAFWQEREWSLWRCAAAGAAVKYGYALKGMEGLRREGGKGGGEAAWQWRCVRSLRKEKVRKLRERYLGSDFNFVTFFFSVFNWVLCHSFSFHFPVYLHQCI